MSKIVVSNILRNKLSIMQVQLKKCLNTRFKSKNTPLKATRYHLYYKWRIPFSRNTEFSAELFIVIATESRFCTFGIATCNVIGCRNKVGDGV